jgi:hypothetical protein
MASKVRQNAASDITRILEDINGCWLEGHPERLEDYFHQDMVIAALGQKVGGRGREACVQSYRGFIDQATIIYYRESDRTIDVCGDTAVACYRFEMSYRMNDQQHHDVGYDLFVFSRQEERWWAVWRTIIPMKSMA